LSFHKYRGLEQEEILQTFQELSLAPSLSKGLSHMNFLSPTPIQAQAIPIALKGRDLIACAQTGTGKTAAFGVPMVELLLKNRDSIGLVLVPTRELAMQVTDVFRQLVFHAPHLRVVSLIGGVSMHPQLRALKSGYRIVIATPGRLVDHLERGSVDLGRLSMLTLDEADRMLDMGFAPQLRRIFSYLPSVRQTLLFSATLPPNIREMSGSILRNPVEVSVGSVSKPAEKIEQATRFINGDEKNALLLDEINHREGSILIFTRTQRRTDRLTRYLESYGIPAGRIHGGRSQGQRNRALDEFRKETTRILVATDIAARGIDIDHVAHVINYDLPQVAEDYVHRIGRTARAGRDGQALSLISPEEKPLWKEIEKLLKGQSKTAPVQRLSSQPNPHASAENKQDPVVGIKKSKKIKFKPRRAR
jgi:superfamily II DNA/RNA helicase